MKKLRRALGAIGALRSSSKDESEGTEYGNTSRVSVSSSRSFSPGMGETLPVRLRSQDEEDTYVRYETESMTSISPSVNYSNPPNTNDPLFTKLHKWAYVGHLAKIKKFSKNNINGEDEEGRTALHLCAFGGHTEGIHVLLAAGGNMEAKDKDGRTPLLRAIERGHIAIMQIFIKNKVKVEVKDHYDNNALHVAAQSGSKDMVEILVEIGVDFEHRNVRGQTPIHIAAQNVHIDVVKSLISYGANPNACDKKGISALMLAAKQGCKELVEILINLGADPSLLDCSGWNASSYAKYCGHVEVQRWIDSIITENTAVNVPMLGLGPSSIGPSSSDTKHIHKLDDTNLDDSWNDDDESSNGKAGKPVLNIPLFMLASNHSINSDKSSLSPKNHSSSVSGPGPPKPPRSFSSTPNLFEDNSNFDRNERFSHLRKMSNTQSIHELRTSTMDSRKSSINYNMDILFPVSPVSRRESRSSVQEFSDITFDDEDDDDNSDISLPIMEHKTSKSKRPSISKDFKKQESLPLVSENQEHETLKDSNLSKGFEGDSEAVNEDIIEKYTLDLTANIIRSVSNEGSIANKSDAGSIKLTTESFDSSEESKSEKIEEMILSNPTDLTVTKSSSSKIKASPEGTLGRIDTLQQIEEIWEANANVSLQNDNSESSNESSNFSVQLSKDSDNNNSGLQKTFFGDSKENINCHRPRVNNNNTNSLYKSNIRDRLSDLSKFALPDRISKRKLSTVSTVSSMSEDKIEVNEINSKINNQQSFLDFLELGLVDSLSDDEVNPPFNVDNYSIDDLNDPLDVEQIQNVICSLKILWNREQIMIENYKLKESKLKEYDSILRENMEHLRHLKSKHESDISSFCLKTNQLEYDLLKCKDESMYALKKLEDAQNNISLLEIENRDLRLSVVERETLLANLQQSFETCEEVSNFWQTKYTYFQTPLRLREDQFSQTTRAELVNSESQTIFEEKETKGIQTDEEDSSGINQETHEDIVKKMGVINQDAWTDTTDFVGADVYVENHCCIKRNEDNFNESFSQTEISFFQTRSGSTQTYETVFLNASVSLLEGETQTETLTSTTGIQTNLSLSTSGIQTDLSLSTLSLGIQTEELSTSTLGCQTDTSLHEKKKGNLEKDTQTTSLLADLKSKFSQTVNEVDSAFSQTSLEENGIPSDRCSDISSKDEFTQTENDYKEENELFNNLNELRSVITTGNEHLNELILTVKGNDYLKERLDEIASSFTVNKNYLNDELKESSDMRTKVLQELAEVREILHERFTTENDQEKILSFVENIQSEMNVLDVVLEKLDYASKLNDETHVNTSDIIEELKKQNLTKESTNIQQNIDQLSKIISDHQNKTKIDLQNIYKRFDLQDEVLISKLTKETSKNDLSIKASEELLKQLEETISLLVNKLNDERNTTDMVSSLKMSQEECIGEMSNNIEQLITTGDCQLQHNLKASFENLDVTVGENFKILQTIVLNLQNDLTKKINDKMITKSNENQSSDESIQNMSKELREMNDSLKRWKSLIESFSTERNSLYDESVIEAIRGGNDQALTALKSQSESILKTLEGYSKSLKENNDKETNFRSEIERHKTETRTEIYSQKEKFEKQLRELELNNENINENLKQERKVSERYRETTMQLENEIVKIKKENEQLKSENYSLKINNERLLMQINELNYRSVEENKSKDEISKKLYDSLQTIALSKRDTNDIGESHQTELIRNLRNEIETEKQNNKALLDENIRIMEEIGKKREENFDHIKNLQKQIVLKEEQIKSLEKQIIENEFRVDPSSDLRKDFANEINSLKESKRSIEEDNRNKNKIIRDLKEKNSDLESERKDLNLELNLKLSQIIELKKEIGVLQNKVRSLSMKIDEKSNNENDNEKLLLKIEELETDASYKQSLILGLRERLSCLGQEKMHFMRDISHLREKDFSSEILLKQKEEAEHALKTMEKELVTIKDTIEQEFVPKSKLNSFYHEMESYFEGIYSNRKWEHNQSATDELKSLEHRYKVLKERETRLQVEMLHFEDEIKVLNAKLSFAHYNIHIWKSKYQNLFEEHYKLPDITPNRSSNTINRLLKSEKNLHETKSFSQEKLLQEIAEYLETTNTQSEFINSAVSLPFTKEVNSMSSHAIKTTETPTLSVNMTSETDRYTVIDFIETNIKKHLQAERTDANPTITMPRVPKSKDATYRSSAPTISFQPLQESFDSYVNFLKRY